MDNNSGDLLNEFLYHYQEVLAKMGRVNIMILGKTGVGKSTLINSVFRDNLATTGVGNPITQHLRKYSKDGMPLAIYDSKGLELAKSVQEQIKAEIHNEITRRGCSGNNHEYIHVLWYCINATSNRIEEFEVQWIKELSLLLPVIVVLTQCIGESADELARYIDNRNLPVKTIHRVLAQSYKINQQITIPSYGLDELVKTTYEILPEAVKKAFVNAQKVDIEFKAKTALKWSVAYISGSFGAGFAPIPFSQAVILAPIQIGMLAHITAIFGVSVSKSLMTTIIGSISGTGGATLAGRFLIANLLKFVPGLGTVAGGMITGAIAATLTTGLAYAYINVMKIVAKAEYQGKRLSNEEIARMVKEQLSQELKKKH